MKKFLFGAVMFPVIVMTGWIGILTAKRSTGVAIELSVRGYDPRDFLSGHYITYAVDYGDEDFCKLRSGLETCVCLMKQAGEPTFKLSQYGECAHVSASCGLKLKGTCTNYGTFSAGIERFYFNEAYSEVLAVAPPKSTIRIIIDTEGHGIVSEYLVDGVPLVEYVRKVQAEPSP